MDEFLKQAFPIGAASSPASHGDLLLRFLIALGLGVVIAVIYRFTQRPQAPAASSFITTLVLLTILLAMVTQVIGNSAALAFSLVGILAIVRFRTTVEDTRDTAFVVFAVVVGMAAGVNNLAVAALGVVVVGAASAALRFIPLNLGKSDSIWLLQLRIALSAGEAMPWDPVLAKFCTSFELTSTATARQGAALELTYKLRLKADVAPMQFLSELNRVEGVQNLEMKRDQQ